MDLPNGISKNGDRQATKELSKVTEFLVEWTVVPFETFFPPNLNASIPNIRRFCAMQVFL